VAWVLNGVQSPVQKELLVVRRNCRADPIGVAATAVAAAERRRDAEKATEKKLLDEHLAASDGVLLPREVLELRLRDEQSLVESLRELAEEIDPEGGEPLSP